MKKTTENKLKYRINDLIMSLPRNIDPVKDMKEIYGIPERTFFRDKSIKLGTDHSISSDRLRIYASYFLVPMEYLFLEPLNHFKPKIKIKTGLK